MPRKERTGGRTTKRSEGARRNFAATGAIPTRTGALGAGTTSSSLSRKGAASIHDGFSGILLCVRRGKYILGLSGIICLACGLAAQAPPPAASQTPTTQAAPVVPRPPLNVVVLDPGHGGTDAGARGASGIVEKDVVLSLARAVQGQLEQQGFRVVLTRQADENPSFDDRAATANAQRGALFISLHVSSSGPAGTARAYFAPTAPGKEAKPGEAAAGVVRWEEAQVAYAAQSRRLAELLQVQLGQKLRGSPEVPSAAPVRQLRLIAAPAIAVELSSVSVADRKQLEQAVPGLAEAVGRAVAAYKTVYEAGGN